jgi:alpha-beta hydrolase superfamily lysophospholipase
VRFAGRALTLELWAGTCVPQNPAAEEDAVAAEQRVEGYLERETGVRLYYCNWLATPERPLTPRPILIVMHGFAEHCRRYDELSEALLAREIGVCRFDARGHGQSSGQRGYVHEYSRYVDDLVAFIDDIAAAHPDRPLALLGHSNGGLIAIRAVQRGLPRVRALAVTSPLLALPPGRRPVPDGVARLLSAVFGRLPLPNGVRAADLTHDEALQRAHAADPWVFRVATPRWYWSTTLAGRAALNAAEQVTLPLLTVLGEADPVVDRSAIIDFHARAGSRDKALLRRPGELHEVLNETARRQLYALLGDWIERVCSSP